MIVNKLYRYAGKVAPRSAAEISKSFFGIGFEKLDRALFEPEKAYDKLAAVGVKKVRIQSGWARTEQEKGVYDFAWLDSIVDNLIARGMEPWMCLCYGNGLYTPAAKEVFGGVGCPPIGTEEERTAWQRYVAAVTEHFRGRITWYEVWNEPDGNWCWKHGVNGAEYGELVKLTAAAIRQGDPAAKVIGGALCMGEPGWVDSMLRTGAGQAMDALSYHAYGFEERLQPLRIGTMRSLLKAHGLEQLPLIQGETGCPSRDDGFGAMRGGAWTPERQAKMLLRTSFLHLKQNVLFTSYFSTMDMVEALNGKADDIRTCLDYGYFGILGADFDEKGIATGEYTPKPSYYAMQAMASVFREEPEICDLPICDDEEHLSWSWRIMQNCEPFSFQQSICFRRPNGSAAIVYWSPHNPVTGSVDSLTALRYLGSTLPEPVRLVDLMDGSIYDLTEDARIGSGSVYQDPKDQTDAGVMKRIFQLPLRDYPLALVFGDFF